MERLNQSVAKLWVQKKTVVPKPDEKMSQAQRECLLHVLRNLSTGVIATLSLLENNGESPSKETLLSCLRGIPEGLQKVINALDSGTFCVLDPDECAFVGKHVGCGRTFPIKN